MSALVISSYLQWEQKSKQHPSYFYSLRFSSPVALCQCTFIPTMVSLLSRCFMTIWITTMILHLHRGGEVLWWARLPVCLCVREHIFGATHTIFTNFLCTLPMVMAGSSSGRWRNRKGKGQFWGFSSPLTMHCNAFAEKRIGREVGDGSAQCGRSVIYDCLVRECA